MLQQEEPDDYVVGTGECHSVKEFLNEAFGYVSLDWREYVETDPKYLRPTEVESLIADISKAKKKLDWSPGVSFKEVVKIMVDSDMELLGLEPVGEGKKVLYSNGITWTDNRITAR
jgi:GDPmannose 4,6-dehydratase